MCISFPLIGYFDEHVYGTAHGILASIFFGSTCIYANILAHLLWENRAHINPALHDQVRLLYWLGWIMCGIMVVFALSWELHINPPVWEWALALLYINYFTFASLMNPYYDSIHPAEHEEQKELAH